RFAAQYLVNHLDPEVARPLESSLLARFEKEQPASREEHQDQKGRGLSSSNDDTYGWINMLAVGEALMVADGLDMLRSPEIAAGFILNLLSCWRQQGRVHGTLTQEEFMVAWAIRLGHSGQQAIAEYTGLTQDEVKQAMATVTRKSDEAG